MTTITTIAQRILDENNYSISDISLVNMEYLIKNVVDHVNLHAGTSISFTPAAGAASLTASDSEIVTVKEWSTLMVRAFLDRGPNTSISSISVSSVIADPQFSIFSRMAEASVDRLRGRSFETT